MFIKRPGHLSSRILLMVGGIVILMTTAFFAFSMIHTRSMLNKALKEGGIALARSVAGTSARGVVKRDPALLEPPVVSLAEYPGIMFVAMYDRDLNLLHQTVSSPLRAPLPPLSKSAVAAALQGQASRGDPFPAGETEVDDFYAPIVFKPTDEPDPPPELRYAIGGVIRIGLSRSRVAAMERHFLIFSIATSVIALTGSILLGTILGRRITKPVAKLEALTRSISEGNLDIQMAIDSQDEVGSLVQAFNAMASALRQTTVSKDYVDSIVASIGEALIVLSPQRVVLSANGAAARLLECEPADLEGKAFETLFAEKPPFDDARWGALLQGELLSGMEASLRARGGRAIPVTLSLAPMFDCQWRLRGVVAVARDVSETMRLIEQLRAHSDALEHHRQVLMSMLEDNERARAEAEAERHKTHAAVDTMSEGVIMFGADRQLLLINPSARRLLRIGAGEEPTASRIAAALGIDLVPFLAAAPTDRASHMLHDIGVGDRTRHTIRVEGMPVGKGNDRLGSLLVLRDITRERQLDEAKQGLITNVSHELRTPLAAVSNIISNILVGVTGPVGEKLRSHLEIARINVKRLTHIIDHLLDISSLDAGRVTIHREIVDLASVVSEAAHEFEPEMEQKQLKFNRLLPAEPLSAYCDPLAVGQVIRSLLSNATRYTPQRGVISLSVSRSDDAFQISVEDTGVGIGPEEQRSIFERFHQVARTYGPGEKGLGLGLPISRHLIEMHGGNMGVTSLPGKGSCFTFRLPCLEGEALIAAALQDMIAEGCQTGVAPTLWIFSPRLSEKARSDELAVMAALERIEATVRSTLCDARHVVAHHLGNNEVLAVIAANSADHLQRITDALDLSVHHLTIDLDGVSIPLSPAIGSLTCSHEHLSSAHYLEEIRKLVL